MSHAQARLIESPVIASPADLPDHVPVRFSPVEDRTPVPRPSFFLYAPSVRRWRDQLASPDTWRRSLRRAARTEIDHGRLFLLVPVLLGAGMVIWFALPTPVPRTLEALCLPLGLLSFVLLRQAITVAGRVTLAFALVLAGAALADFETWRQQTVVLDSPVTTRLEGLIERREAVGERRWRYVLRVLSTREPQLSRPPTHVAVVIRSPAGDLKPGDVLSARMRLSPPSGPAMPGLNDFGFTAYFDGIGAIGYTYGAPEVRPATEENGIMAGVSMTLYGLRGAIGDRIRSLVPGDPGAFAAAIVTDERRAITPETVDALRLSGLAHIVAISGLNMALAAGICFVGLRTLLSLMPRLSQRLPIKKIAAGGALVLVTFYYLISGFGVSAERAYLMMAIMLVAVFFDRPSISLHNIALAAIVILVMSPSSVMGASFQMSFAATAALVAGYASWSGTRENGHAPKRRGPMLTVLNAGWVIFAGTFLTSLIGGLSTSIFSVAHFHQLTAYGLAANLAAMPVISLIVMPAALVGMIAMPFGLDEPFFVLMGQGLAVVIWIAQQVASWGGQIPTGQAHALFLPVGTLGFLTLVVFRTRFRLLGMPLIAAALALSAHPSDEQRPDLLVSEDGRLVALLDGRKAQVNRARPPAFTYRQWQNALAIEDHHPPVVAADWKRRDQASGARVTRTAADATADDQRFAGATVHDPTASRAMAEDPAADGATIGDIVVETAPPAPGIGLLGATPPRAPDKNRQPLLPAEIEEARSRFRTILSNAGEHRFVCLSGTVCLVRTPASVRIAAVEDPRYVGVACDTADIVIASSSRLDACRSGAVLLSGSHLRRLGSVAFRFSGTTDRSRWRLEPAIGKDVRSWSAHRLYDFRTRTNSNEIPPSLAPLINGSGG